MANDSERSRQRRGTASAADTMVDPSEAYRSELGIDLAKLPPDPHPPGGVRPSRGERPGLSAVGIVAVPPAVLAPGAARPGPGLHSSVFGRQDADRGPA